jgi:hypothetical protein
MSGTGLTTILLMIGVVMLLISYWRQVAVFILFLLVVVFCSGVYYIYDIIAHAI